MCQSRETCRLVSVSLHYKFPTKLVGLVQIRFRHPLIEMQLVLTRQSSHIEEEQITQWPKEKVQTRWTYDTPALRQTGSRNLTGQKTLPTIRGTYIKLVTKYQISAINCCWEQCDYPSDFYFLFTDLVGFYTHFSSHFSQKLLMAEIWYLVTSFI
jgi:hypothetical protein